MIGAIIGDMAASTREKDKETFYRQLIYPYCDSNELQCKFIAAIEFIRGQGSLGEFNSLRKGSDYEAIWKHNIIGSIALGWISDSLEQCDNFAHCFQVEKEDWYASHFISKLIFALRHGDTKRRALKVEHVGSFESFVHGHWQFGNGPLGCLVRAWKAFEKSFDFGSALHAAVELPGDIHLNCILVGALADAMYGHQQYIRKRRFVSEGEIETQYIDIKLLDYLQDVERDSWKNRTFFPKNNASTNVERHTWCPVPKHDYSDVHFSKETRRRMLKACYTSWDNRFGLYWDDGWFYMYRSTYVLGRFRLKENEDRTYSITQLQITDDNPTACSDINMLLHEELSPITNGWDLFGDEDVKTTLLHMFKFFDPEVGNPGGMHFGNYWWLWEEMVWKTFEERNRTKISDWWKPDTDFWSKEFPGYCREELCLLDYFTNMHLRNYPNADAYMAVKDRYLKFCKI